MTDKTLTVMALALGLFSAKPAHADVNPGLNAPPPVIAAAPQDVVAIPGSPVARVPSAAYNLFVYGGRYYSLHNGGWFVTTAPRTSWTPVPSGRVPRPILAVPATYYKSPSPPVRNASSPLAVPVGATIAERPGMEAPRP